MLQNRHVGLGYYCTLLLNASPRFPPRWSWFGVPDAISGLPFRASICRILDGWNLRLDAGWPDRQAKIATVTTSRNFFNFCLLTVGYPERIADCRALQAVERLR
jgi:hypothetical protein